jgi:hypothetical protein
MAGQPSGGQIATPNPNSVAGAQMAPVFINGVRQSYNNIAAPLAGMGGDVWGAYGGGATPVGNGVTGVQGWDERVAATVPDGQTAANYQLNPIPQNNRGAPMQPVQQQVSSGAVSQLSFDDALPSGGSNQG